MCNIETEYSLGHDPRMDISAAKKYDIRSDLLADCISHFAAAENKGFYYGVLCYLVCKTFNIHRMNYFADRVYARNLDKYQKENFQNLSEEKLEQACDDLKKLYNFTQEYFDENQSEYTNRTVRLKRGIGSVTYHTGLEADHYEKYIAMTYSASKRLGKTSMRIDMDLMNSFSRPGYNRLITIDLQIPCADVLYISDLTTHKGKEIMESDEYVVVNRSTFGIVEIPIDAIVLHETAWQSQLAKFDKNDEKFSENYLSNSDMFENFSTLSTKSLSQCAVEHEPYLPKRSAFFKIRASLAQWIDPR